MTVAKYFRQKSKKYGNIKQNNLPSNIRLNTGGLNEGTRNAQYW
jgi:hypothetical protein